MPLTDYEEYDQPNWDGYGAEPITPATLAIAGAVSDMLEAAAKRS